MVSGESLLNSIEVKLMLDVQRTMKINRSHGVSTRECHFIVKIAAWTPLKEFIVWEVYVRE